MRLNRFSFILILIFLLLFISCKNTDSNSDTSTEQILEVSVVQVEEKVLDNDLESFGTTTYKTKSDITSQVSGNVYAKLVKDGDYVIKGEPLFKLKNVQLEIQKEQYNSNFDSAKSSVELSKTKLRDEQLSVESRLLSINKSNLSIKQKELELELQKKTFENKKKLNSMGGVTDASLEELKIQLSSAQTDIEILKKELEISMLGFRAADLIFAGYTPSEDSSKRHEQYIDLNTQSAKAELAVAEAQQKAAEQQLSSCNKLIDELTIRSSIAGIIGTCYYENGEYVKENEKVATVIDTSNVFAILYIQEQDIVNFPLDTKLKINIPSINKSYDCKIDEISPIADSQTGNFTVKSIIKNNDGKIKPGMFIKCLLKRNINESYPCIPETCLLSSTSQSSKIFCALNGHAVLKNIEIKAQKNGLVWVSKGLDIKDIVINNPTQFLKEGQSVRAKK